MTCGALKPSITGRWTVWKIIFLWGFCLSHLMLVYVTYISQLMPNRSLPYCRMCDRFWQNLVDVNNMFVISKLFSIFAIWIFFYGHGDLQDSTARTMPQISFHLHYQIETWIKRRNQQYWCFWNCPQWVFGIWLLTNGDLPALFPGHFPAKLQMNKVPFSMDIFLLSVCWRWLSRMATAKGAHIRLWH